MPTLNWIGKDAVVKHHKDVPVTCHLDTAEEVSIYEAGGVLQRFPQDFLEASNQSDGRFL